MSNAFYVNVPKGTRAQSTMPDLHACIAMMAAAKRAGCDEFLVQEPGQRSKRYTMAEVEEQYRKNQIELRGIRGMGEVYGAPDLSIVNTGGRHLTIRKMKQTRGGLFTPA